MFIYDDLFNHFNDDDDDNEEIVHLSLFFFVFLVFHIYIRG